MDADIQKETIFLPTPIIQGRVFSLGINDYEEKKLVNDVPGDDILEKVATTLFLFLQKTFLIYNLIHFLLYT